MQVFQPRQAINAEERPGARYNPVMQLVMDHEAHGTLVRPRVRCAGRPEPVPLHDVVERMLLRGARGAYNLYGPPGSGKTTALHQLEATFGDHPNLELMDDGSTPAWSETRNLLIYTTDEPTSGLAFALAPWTRDEWIEYMLARWRHRCSSVMSRVLKDSFADALEGNPHLWTTALDALAQGPDLLDIRNALRRRVARLSLSPQRHAEAADVCLKNLTHDLAEEDFENFFAPDEDGFARLLRHRPVRLLLASDMLVYLLCDVGDAASLGELWPAKLVREAAMQLQQREGAPEILESALESKEQRTHPVAASLLLAMHPTWRPSGRYIPNLGHAKLSRAQWQHVDLFGARLLAADLTFADLRSARLTNAKATKARFCSADLRSSIIESLEATSADFGNTDLSEAHGDRADFSHANLAGAKLRRSRFRNVRFVGANLKGADLCGSDLRKSRFSKANLEGADFTSANLTNAIFSEARIDQATLTGARLVKAYFTACNFEGMELDAIDFTRATLYLSLLTGASLRRSILRKADLRQTGLANVDLEGADLRGADLRGASFHLGSSRSGLVGSVIPCEGSKTGFYTDERDEHHFRAPEDIRKANLRHADLRGARIKGVDFYLVDLRGARYTRKQGKYFARCGAIIR